MTITQLILAGALAGLAVSLVPSRKTGCMVLWLVPLAMLIAVSIELSDPERVPDALDALLFVFGPLWPSLGALAGFTLGRVVRGFVVSRWAGRQD